MDIYMVFKHMCMRKRKDSHNNKNSIREKLVTKANSAWGVVYIFAHHPVPKKQVY